MMDSNLWKRLIWTTCDRFVRKIAKKRAPGIISGYPMAPYEEPAVNVPGRSSGEGTRNLLFPTVEYDPIPAFSDLQPTGTSSDIFYYHTNHLGSTAYVTDQSQNVTQGFLYAPFGEITTEYAPLWQNGTLPKYAFNAKELDEETGMYYYEARYYKPPVFTSRDPMMNQKPWLSPYHYCSNNPVGRIDPSGMLDEGPDDPPGKKTFQAKPKIEVNVVPQDNLQQKPLLLPIEQHAITSKKGLLQRLEELLYSNMTGGLYETAENGQGQEKRKGDGPQTDVSGFTSNMPEPNPPKIDRRAYYKNSSVQNYDKEDSNDNNLRTPLKIDKKLAIKQ